MRIELSEMLACPRCGPEQGVVLLVDEFRGRRVLSGRLGCPECDGRYPVWAGVVDLSAGPSEGEAGPEAEAPSLPVTEPDGGREPDGGGGGGDEGELAVEVAALLDVPNRKRPVLLGPRLGASAARVAELAEGVEILLLVEGGRASETASVGAPSRETGSPEARGPARPEGAESAEAHSPPPREGTRPENLTCLVGAFGGTLPVLSRKLGGVALRAPEPGAVREGARTLAAGGRLVGLRPGERVRETLSELPLRVMASEERAFVLSRGGERGGEGRG